MPRGYANVHHYDGRSSIPASGRQSRVRYGSQVYSFHSSDPGAVIKSEPDDASADRSFLDYTRACSDDIEEDVKPSIEHENTTEGASTPGPDQTGYNYIQHLISLPYNSQRPRGRSAVRQGDRDRDRSRSPVHECTPSLVPSSRGSSPSMKDEPQTACICPTGYECPARRSDDKLDCRTLTVEWQKWHDRTNQESYDVHMAVPFEDAPCVTEERIMALERFLQDLEGHTPARRNEATTGIGEWVSEMKRSNITAEFLFTTQIVNTLDTFLDDNNAQMRARCRFPISTEEEMRMLLFKWARGDLTCNQNRGLTRVVTLDQNGIPERTVYRLDKQWEHYISADFYGEGHLVNGQLFGDRQQLMRDGAHSAPVSGICGTVKKGARSIVMGYHDTYRKDYYADVDMGNTIDYMGTALKPEKKEYIKVEVDEDVQEDTDDPSLIEPTNIPDPDMNTRIFDNDKKPTACTQMLMTSFKTGNPVRVIRSPGLASQVKNKPHKCYRYDGLYKVVRMTPLKLERQIWSFRLERLPGQGPLRGFKDGETQPSSAGKRYGYSRYNASKYAGRW